MTYNNKPMAKTTPEGSAKDLVRHLSKLGTQWRTALVKPELINEEKRSAEIVWTTGATVRRSGWFSDWEETLEVSEAAIVWERMRSGAAPLLKNHDGSDIANVIGVVERAWVEGNEGRAVVRFSEREEVQAIFKDVKDGILRNISVGYRVLDFTETTKEAPEGEETVRSFLATRWEPLEVSIVAIGADAAAGFRSDTSDSVVPIPTETETVEKPVVEVSETTTKGESLEGEGMEKEMTPDLQAVRDEAIKAERARSAEIMKAVRAAKLEEAFGQDMIERGVSIEEARKAVIDKLAEKPAPKTESHVRVEVGTETRDNLLVGAEQALLHRHRSDKYKAMDERGKQFVGMRLIDVAREFCEAKGIKTRGMSVSAIAERALHSTSDFPLLLSNVAAKTLRDEYAEAPATYAPIVREVELPDYKEKTVLQVSGDLKLEALPEGGEYKRGTLGEGKDSYQLADYGKVIAVTRKTIINDDLGAFTRVPGLFGRAARDLVQDMVWAIIGQNATMGDGIALFHADHLNLAVSAAAIDVTPMSLARKAMRLQKDPAGKLIQILPQYMIVPAALETKAQQFLAQTTPNQNSQVNPFAGSLQLIVVPQLDKYSETAWYVAASPSQLDMIEIGYLAGEAGPQIATREGFEVEGIEIKCRMTVATKAMDHRGFYKNAGV